MTLTFFLLFLFFGLSASVTLYNVRQLTVNGTHSHPRFSADNRYVYFSATGSTYDKDCEDIYRLDLKYWNSTTHPSRISRVSTGIGYSNWASLNYEGEESLVFESTFEQAIANQQVDNLSGTCPHNKCLDSPKPEACKKDHVIRFPDTYIYKRSATNPLLQRVQDAQTTGSFSYAPALFGNTLAYGQSCQTHITPNSGAAYDTNSTCFLINNVRPFNEDTGTATYYDGFAVGKETSSGRIRVVYEMSTYSSLDLPDPNVFPLDDVDLYDAVLEADGQTIITQYSNRHCEPTYLTKMRYPQVFQPNADPGTLYTAIDATGKHSVKACFGRGYDSQLIVESVDEAKMAAPRSDYKQIVFVGRMSAQEDFQLYIADLEDNLANAFDSKPLIDVNREVIPNMKLLSSVELDGQLGRIRLSQHTKEIYFEQNLNTGNAKCMQLYYVDNDLNDFSSPTLLSTGLGSVDGFDIYSQNGDNRIVYAGDFTMPAKDATKENVHRCYLTGCDDPNADNTLKAFCAGKVTKHFGLNFELFLAKLNGHLELRITNNNGYEGEVAVDYKNNRLYYSTFTANRVDIAYRALDNLQGAETIVTSRLAAGYYGGVAIADQNTIVYHAYKPQAADMNTFTTTLNTYQVVDTSILEIYSYNLVTNTETQITTLNARSMNPAYTNDGTILFQTNAGNTNLTRFSMYKAELGKIGSTKIFDTTPTNPHSISFASESIADFAFVADASVTTKTALYLGTYKAFRETTTFPTLKQATTTPVQIKKITTTQAPNLKPDVHDNSAIQTVTQSVWLLCAAFVLRNV